ncbi:Nucleotidylyl transferase [Thozetella sp. PMI_491]|nr:Nucleotidylyl transferase [Thozetella sp. PMI_491]
MSVATRRDELPSLLLLPYPPDPASRQVLSAAYRPSLAAALSRLRNSESRATLIVAVACPVLHGQFARHKTLSWPEAQSLLAGIYALIAVVCSQLSIPTEADGGPGSVDVTVVLVDHNREKRFQPDFHPVVEPNNTIVVDLATFASAYYPWNYIFHARSEVGLEVYQTFLRLFEGRQTLRQDQLVAVEGGITLNVAPGSSCEATPQTATYPAVCLGGTFDHLHPGHKLLLTAAALLLRVPEKVSARSCQFIIGITGDEMLKKKKYAAYVQSWEDRARGVIAFLSLLLGLAPSGWKSGPRHEEQINDGDVRAVFRDGTISVQCVEIQDPFGPTVTVQNIDAIVVSGETRSGGAAVNDRRTAKGWHPLEVFEVDVLDASEIQGSTTESESFATKISSTAIRQARAQAEMSQ